MASQAPRQSAWLAIERDRINLIEPAMTHARIDFLALRRPGIVAPHHGQRGRQPAQLSTRPSVDQQDAHEVAPGAVIEVEYQCEPAAFRMYSGCHLVVPPARLIYRPHGFARRTDPQYLGARIVAREVRSCDVQRI